MKHKKFSDAILCGFKKVGGKQRQFLFCTGDPKRPTACCVRGAANLCEFGSAVPEGNAQLERDWSRINDFYGAWGLSPDSLNDEGMPWEHIYGMARAAGL